MMNRQEQYDEDLLRKYINPEKLEKAPEGFTSRTLTRIQIKSQSALGIKSFFRRNRVPLISFVIIAGLIIAAVSLPVNENDVVSSAILKFLRNIQLSLSQIRLTGFKGINLPGWTAYAYLGILILALIDWALAVVFRKQIK